jgi:hypothetical protein
MCRSCVDEMRGQGISLTREWGDLWIRFTDEHLTQIVERLLRTPGVAVVDLSNLQAVGELVARAAAGAQ